MASVGAAPSKPQGCLRLAAFAATTACTALILLTAAWSSSTPPRPNRLVTSMPAAPSIHPAKASWCAFGTLPGIWVSADAQPGSHWTVLNPQCQLQPLLSAFTSPASSGTVSTPISTTSHHTPATSNSEGLELSVLDTDSDTGLTRAGQESLSAQQEAPQQTPDAPTASILFISDSIDRHVMTYLCEHVGGTVKATVLKNALALMGLPADTNASVSESGRAMADGAETAPDAGAAAAGAVEGTAAGGAAARTAPRRRNAATGGRTKGKRQLGYGGRRAARSRTSGSTHDRAATVPYFAVGDVPPPARRLASSEPAAADGPQPAASAPASGGGGGEPPSGYVVNTCSTPSGRLRLLATYIPGVHPVGPFHKQRTLAYSHRIDHATAVWRTYSSTPPDIVVVASLLWDLARASAYEPAAVSGPELPRSFLDSWAANYTQVVRYAQAQHPKTKLWVYHTAASPRHSPSTGVMDKSYLGQANHIRQLNAVGKHAAQQLDMEVVDYAQVASRFQEGQIYLTDQIHPGQEVGLELANVYLNYVQQLHS